MSTFSSQTLSRGYALQRGRQRGVILIFALVALLILGIGAVALIRSFDTSTVTAVNLAFKRDLSNQGSLAFTQVDAWFADSGKLGDTTLQQSNSGTLHYFATTQTSDAHGIPTTLLDTDPGNGYKLTSTDILAGTTIYFMIDRQCSSTGAPTISNCAFYVATADPGGGRLWDSRVSGFVQPLFRITVRVDGPHDTHTFLQKTIAD